jgi:hypothetical protein
MKRCALVLAALVAILAPATAQAKTGPPLEPFPHPEVHVDHGPRILSDGSRYFLINARLGVVRIYDTRTAAVHDFEVPDECSAVAATKGIALVTCRNSGTPDGTPYLLRLSDRRFYVAPGAEKAGYVVWYAIGRHWLEGRAGDGVGKPTTFWLNWRTGKQKLDDYYSPTYRDRDDPKLRLWPNGLIAREGNLSVWHGKGKSTILRRPGPDARLTTCSEAWGEWGCGANLSSGLVSWIEGTAIRTYDARSKQRLGWYLQGYEPDLPHQVVHTRDHILIWAVRPPNSGDLLWARVR